MKIPITRYCGFLVVLVLLPLFRISLNKDRKNSKMKTTITLAAFGMMVTSLFGQQETVNLSLNAGYTHQSYYSLKNGEVKNVDNTDWDLAFDVGAIGSGIRINDAQGTELYLYPKGDVSNWGTVDTSGLNGWPQLRNSTEKWLKGAFQQHTTSDPTDLGWGKYSTITHQVTGDSIYIIRLSSGNWNKLMIEKLASGKYTFKYAELNGANEKTGTLTKADFAEKRFGYYSLQTHKSIDREPKKADWDIVFTSYVTTVGPGVYYGVTGALLNTAIQTGVAEKKDVTTVTPKDVTFEEKMDAIGYNWKKFQMGSGFVMADSLSYFVHGMNGNTWHIVFKSFEGRSTGKFTFTKEMIKNETSISELSQDAFTVYPNPTSTGQLNVKLTNSEAQVQLELLNLSGQVFANTTEEATGSITMDVSNVPAGNYFLRINDGKAVTVKQVVVQ